MNTHDLAAAYAMDALEPSERMEFKAHLETCPDCRRDVAELQEITAQLGAAEEATPNPRLRQSVLNGIRQIDQEQVVPTVTSLPPRRQSPWLAAATVALVAAVVALVFIVVQLDDRVDRAETLREIMAAPDVAIASLEGDLVGQFYYSLTMDQAVLVSDEVPSISGDETYELWLIDSAGPIPAGLFRPSKGAVTLIVDGGLTQATLVGVTIEPMGGSDAPTGEILASALVG
jgi:anti-sigma-K factor RskA